MKGFDNTFVRGQSPSYSDSSENVMSATLPIGSMPKNSSTGLISNADQFLQDKFNCVFDSASAYSAATGQPVKYGRNTFAFWSVIVILLILTVGNLMLTLTIMGVLHMGKGINGMELIPEEGLIKFSGSTDLDKVYAKNSGLLEGFADVPVSITGEQGGGVYVRLQRNGQTVNRLLLDAENGIQFKAINSFEMKATEDGPPIFSTHRPHYNMPQGANVLEAKLISSSRIASDLNKPLTMETSSRISFKGSEGIRIDGESVFMKAENLYLNSTQSISMTANEGIYLDMEKIPIVSSELGLRTGSLQYKLCVCMPQGNLFRIAIPRIHNGPKISCAHFSSKHDPCAMS